MFRLRFRGTGVGLGLGLALGADAPVAHGHRVARQRNLPELARTAFDELESTHAGFPRMQVSSEW